MSGTIWQRMEFLLLWESYWGQKITPDPEAYRWQRRFCRDLALFEQTWILSERAIAEAALKIPRL